MSVGAKAAEGLGGFAGAAVALALLVVAARMAAVTSSLWLFGGLCFKPAVELATFAWSVSEFSLVVAYEASRLGLARPDVALSVSLAYVAGSVLSSYATKKRAALAEAAERRLPWRRAVASCDAVLPLVGRALGGELGKAAQRALYRVVLDAARLAAAIVAVAALLHVASSFGLRAFEEGAILAAAAAALAFFALRSYTKLRKDVEEIYEALPTKEPTGRALRRAASALLAAFMLFASLQLALLASSRLIEEMLGETLGPLLGRVAAAVVLFAPLALLIEYVVARSREAAAKAKKARRARQERGSSDVSG